MVESCSTTCLGWVVGGVLVLGAGLLLLAGWWWVFVASALGVVGWGTLRVLIPELSEEELEEDQ